MKLTTHPAMPNATAIVRLCAENSRPKISPMPPAGGAPSNVPQRGQTGFATRARRLHASHQSLPHCGHLPTDPRVG